MSKNFENKLVLPTAGKATDNLQMQNIEGGSDTAATEIMLQSINLAISTGALNWRKSTFALQDGGTHTQISGPMVSPDGAWGCRCPEGVAIHMVITSPTIFIRRDASGGLVFARKTKESTMGTHKVWSYASGVLIRN
ncbi:MAG: hypothetical protein FWB72_01940 [Firmicutes bacterium]|nr:hypothetical protein [Bacillota bacterium]